MTSKTSIETIFSKARTLPVGPERESFLKSACSDTAMRDMVEALLSSDENAGDFLSEPAGESVGQVIDRYHLLEQIGEGGMGTVWMAEQREPVRRQVALKIIKLGMDTKEVVLRFEAERQALALMEHPHIARVFDGGTTAHGRPYFVMELVRGVPITEYCDQTNLGLRERLELFAKVCDAVQHAHHKGVIHRDIKPSNVMVTLHDGVPVPKVIDFGIAKATSAELTQHTLFTQYAQIVGTPEYMAPEQAEMSGLDIDTRADVYSLGVLLYELLTGTKPFDARDVIAHGYEELLRTIREVDPARPSTRISTLGKTATPIAASRHASTESLRKRLAGDLDWIVMRALEKNRTRRYDTPTSFAEDIKRFLRGDAVHAAPPSKRYRIAKFVQRRRKAVAAAAIIATLLVAGTIGTGLGWWEAQQANDALGIALAEKGEALVEAQAQRAVAEEQREMANANARDAEEQRVIAQAALDDLRVELARVKEVKAIVTAMLNGANPRLATGADTTLVRGMLEDTEARLDAGEIGDELVAAEIHQTLATIKRALSVYDEAEEHATKAAEIYERRLPPISSEIATINASLASIRAAQGDWEASERHARRSLEIFDQLESHEPSDEKPALFPLCLALVSLRKFDDLNDAAARFRETTVTAHGEDSPRMLDVFFVEGNALALRGDFAGAIKTYKTALAGHDRWIDTEKPAQRELQSFKAARGQVLFSLCSALQSSGELVEAETYGRESLALALEIFGDSHRDAAGAKQSLAITLSRAGRFDEAIELFEEAYALHTSILGAAHYDTIQTAKEHGLALMFSGRWDEAAAVLVPAVDIARGESGDEWLLALSTLLEYGGLSVAQSSKDESALDLLGECTDVRRRLFGPHAPRTHNARATHAKVLSDFGRHAEAVELFKISYAAFFRAHGPRHQQTATSLAGLNSAANELGISLDVEEIAQAGLRADVQRVVEGDRDLHLMKSLAYRIIHSPDTHVHDAKGGLLVTRALIAEVGNENPMDVFLFAKALIANGKFDEAEEQIGEMLSREGIDAATRNEFVNLAESY